MREVTAKTRAAGVPAQQKSGVGDMAIGAMMGAAVSSFVHTLAQGGNYGVRAARVVTIYRDDSTAPVCYTNVKAWFWTANNSVLVIAQYANTTDDAHSYIHWPRERFCWFRDEPATIGKENAR